MTLKTTLILSTTAIERSMGRFMKAPDHDASGGATTPPADGQKGSGNQLSTEDALEKEFINDEESGSVASTEGDDAEDDFDEDDEDDEEDDSEADGDEDEDDSDGDDAEEDRKPKKSRAQERIDELTNYGRSKEREAQQLRDEVIRLGGNPDAVGEPATPEAPDPSKYQYGEQDVDYIRDHAKYEAKLEVLEEQAKATFKAQAAELDAKWSKNQAAALTKYADFDEVVVKGATENKWPCPPVIAVAIKDSDVGADVAYHLASNPEEANRIAKLTPLEQAREFGRIEERLTRKLARDTRRAEQRPNRVSKAPPPPKRRTQGAGAKRGIKYDTDFASFEKSVDSQKLIR